MASRPLNLLDLPDEILCQILEYCCQDLDYLLWSSSAVSPKRQPRLSNHCSQCHTRQQRLETTQPHSTSKTTQRQTSMYNSNLNLSNGTSGRQYDSLSRSKQPPFTRHDSSSTGSTESTGNTSSSETILRKRRRRTIAEGGQGVMAARGVNPSKRASRLRYDHPDPFRHQGATLPDGGSSFWSRHFARFVLNSRLREYFRSSTPHHASSPTPLCAAVTPQTPHWSQSHPLSGMDSSKPSVTASSLGPTAATRATPLPLPASIHANASQGVDKTIGYSSEHRNPGKKECNGHSIATATTTTTTTTTTTIAPSFFSHATWKQPKKQQRRQPRSTSINRSSYINTHCSSSSSSGTTYIPYTPSSPLEITNVTMGADDEGHEEIRDAVLPAVDEQGMTTHQVKACNDTNGEHDCSIGLSTPFQLLMVNKRLADLTVQLLWKGVVFHGHNSQQMESLLSTLSQDEHGYGEWTGCTGCDDDDDGTQQQQQQAWTSHGCSGSSQMQEMTGKERFRPTSMKGESRPCATMIRADDINNDEDDKAIGHNTPRFIPHNNEHTDTRATPLRHAVDCGKQGDTSEDRKIGACTRGHANCNASTASTIASTSQQRPSTTTIGLLPNKDDRDASSSSTPGPVICEGPISLRHSNADVNANANVHTSTTTTAAADASLCSQGSSSCIKCSPLFTQPRWSYRSFVKRVVLNFAHTQASPQLLVKALECIRSNCRDQIQALDLHANEKMQAAGLEQPSELERLFGSGFSKLRYLRLQGGLIDNQLLGALIKGLTVPLPPAMPSALDPPRTPCQLSQVFLGPGSITDSAIDKLIIAAGHSIEVFAVTSCVDLGGGALANLLTRCPKLKVLSIHRSLARDRELFEELGVDMDDTSSQTGLNRKEIIAPLERLELGMVKLTTEGVTEIIQGTRHTLKYLVLETQHFKNDFLRDTIAPLCRNLEGLYFNEPDLPSHQQHQHQQQHHLAAQNQGTGPGVAHQRPRRSFFGLRRNRRHDNHHPHHTPATHESGSHVSPSGDAMESDTPSMPRQSPWLGEISTCEWVKYGNCAMWTANSVGSTMSYENNGSGAGAGQETSTPSRARNFTLIFRAIGRRLISMFSSDDDNDGNHGQDGGNISTLHAMAPGTHLTMDREDDDDDKEGEYARLLERFGIDVKTIDTVLQSLRPSLKTFKALKSDMIQGHLEAASAIEDSDVETMDTIAVPMVDVGIEDKVDTFLKLVVVLGVLALGTLVSIRYVQQGHVSH